jgi:cytochrome c6
MATKPPCSLRPTRAAACHTGGNNVVQAEKTLRKAALEQYLDGGFNVEAITYQVENGKNAMPAWSSRLSEEEIAGVAAYVYSQASGDLW